MSDYMPPPPELSLGSTVWVYLRDSGGSAQELSVKQQQDEVERFAAQYGLIIRHIFADVARTRTTTVGRGAFNDMIDMALGKSTPSWVQIDIRPWKNFFWLVPWSPQPTATPPTSPILIP